MSETKRIGFAVCGSFCTFSRVMKEVRGLVDMGYDVYPIMSEQAYLTDTRFGKAEDFRNFLKEVTGREIITSIKGAEPIGPKAFLDALIIAPCTGNTIAKLANSVTDSVVTMAAKANLRNERPLVIAVSTNDGLCGNAQNIGKLLSRRNVYFVPFGQDDPAGKPTSMIADYSLLPAAIDAALEGRQLQPILL